MLWAYPSLIMPRFNRFEPLPEGPLRERLAALSKEAGFRNRGPVRDGRLAPLRPLERLFAGLFRPRIILFDTLVQQMSVDEAASVLAHEIGHYRRHHVQRMLAVSLAGHARHPGRALAAAALAAALRGLRVRGARRSTPRVALLSLGGGAFVFWLAPAGVVLLPAPRVRGRPLRGPAGAAPRRR